MNAEMKIQAVARSYWRSIKRGNRTYESLGNISQMYGYPSIQEQVLYLASLDLEEGVISEEEFSMLIMKEV